MQLGHVEMCTACVLIKQGKIARTESIAVLKQCK